MKEIKISIIIPYFNASEYIEKCIESILMQTLKEIEIIVINDESSDEEKNILLNVCRIDNRIRIIDILHSGPGKARNIGIQEAKGRYVGFVDADDYLLTESALEEMYNAAIKNNALICGAERQTLVDNNRLEFNYKFEKNSTKGGWVDFRDFQECYDYQNYIYKRDFLITNRIDFPDLARYQDPPFFVSAMSEAKKFWGMHILYYCYRLGHQDRRLIEERINCILRGILKVLEICVKNYYLELTKRVVDEQINEEYFDTIYNHLNPENLRILIEINTLIGEKYPIKVLEKIKNTKVNEEKIKILEKSQYLLRLLLKCKSQGFKLDEYLCEKFGSSVVIYGGGYWGNIVYEELCNTDIEIIGIVDVNNAKLANLKTYTQISDIPKCDVVLVALLEPSEVEKKIRAEIGTNIISIEECLNES